MRWVVRFPDRIGGRLERGQRLPLAPFEGPTIRVGNPGSA